MRPPRPQLTFDELNQLRWLLGGILTLLAVVTVAYMDVEAWWVMAPTAAVCLASTLWPKLVARIPRMVHVLAFPVIAAFFAADLWLKSELLPAMVRLDMLLLMYRAAVYRQRRDDLQVIVLGLFLVVVAGVLTVSLSFAMQILLYTACALIFLLVLTLVDSAQMLRPGETATPAATPSWAAHVSWGRLLARVRAVLDWRIATLGGGLFLGLIAASALLFLVIPRFQLDNGMFLDRFITRKARTGFSDSIKFGDVTEIQKDNSVALHVDVSDAGQIPLTPYWRMLLLDDYHDGAFRLSPALRMRAFERTRTGVMIYGTPTRNRALWTVYLEPGISRYLPLLGRFRQLKFAEAQTFEAGRDVGVVGLTKEPVTMTAYQVEGFDLAARLRDSPEGFYGPRSLQNGWTLGAEDVARLRRVIAQSAQEEPAGAAAFASKVNAWLREHHPYSLAPRIPSGSGDPLVRWLDSTAAGHCELFAGSFVLLARAAGYPARVVVGYRGGNWNGFADRSFIVRNSDAHAWAEIYDRETNSWLRADPLEVNAAGGTNDNAAAATAALRTDRSLSARLDSLRVFWYRRVVSFDQQTQIHTLKAAKEGVQAAIGRLRERLSLTIGGLRAWWSAPWDFWRGARMAGTVAGAALLTWIWRRTRLWGLQWWLRRRPAGRSDPIRREAGRWLRWMALFEAPATDAVVADLQRLRFGARESWPDAASVFRRARHFSRTEGRSR